MHPSPNTSRPASRSRRRRAPHVLTVLSLGGALAAQAPFDCKPAPLPDPVKGWHDMSPLPAEALAARRGLRPAATSAAPDVGAVAASRRDRVLFDQPGDGHVWALGATYKASFGDDGFTFVPFLGSQAPQNFPVRFELRSVRVGGHELALPPAAPVLTDHRVQLARGSVLEQYDLALEQVEQTFTIDDPRAGDVDIELQVISELPEDAARPGLQFANDLGSVHYGSANVVDGDERTAVPTTFDGRSIRIHVAAALRRSARLVVDPVIHTETASPQVAQQGQPDLAYDASTDTFFVVWEEVFSASDADVWGEFRQTQGAVVPGTLLAIDVTTINATHARTANINASDTFFTVFQRFDASSGFWQVWGRARYAGTMLSGPMVYVSQMVSGHCYLPDIGGDPSPVPGPKRFLIAWEREISPSDIDILGRMVDDNSLLVAPVLAIAISANTVDTTPFVSQSNGNGEATSPCWLVAFEHRFSATDHDILAAAIGPTGAIVTPATAVDSSINDDLVPNVSSPATDLGGNQPLFMVAYERVAPTPAAMARLLRPTTLGIFVNEISATNLTQAFSLPGAYVKCDCDGCRFAVVTGVGNRITTLALAGTQLVIQEPLQNLPGAPAYVRLVSKHSGGGPRTRYGVVSEDRSFNPYRARMTTYDGHSSGPTFTTRAMACNGLQIAAAGNPFLGEQATFTLTNPGSDIPGFLFGLPTPTFSSAVFCGPLCPTGVDFNGAILVAGATLPVTIPCDVGLVGSQFAVQGLGLGSGPCIASLRFSDTIDMFLR